MKTNYLVPFIILSLSVACTRELEYSQNVDSNTDIACNIIAEMPSFKAEPLTDTKSSIEAVLRIKWSLGDKLSVVNITTGKKLGGYIEAQSEGNQVQFIGKNLNGELNVGHKLLFINDSESYSNKESDFNPSIIDFSVQKGNMNNVPYCIYATYTATDAESINASSLKFNFLISYIQLAVSGLPSSSEISDFTINGICSKCEISVSDGVFTATPIEDNLSLSEPFTSNSKGAQMRYFSSFQSDAKETARSMSANSGNHIYPGNWIKAALNKGTYYQSVAAGFTDNYIHFKDECFKSLCVADADINGDGEVSYNEASTLQSFAKWNFRDAQRIKDASDFVYFSSISSVPAFNNVYGNNNSLDLTSIVLPTSVKEIPNYFLKYAEELQYIDIPENVETIGKEAFSACYHLRDVIFPSSLKTIGDRAFSGCESITTITIPENIEAIGENAFGGCWYLEKIDIQSPATKIKARAFDDCRYCLTEVTIPEGAVTLDAIFQNCSALKTVHLPSSLKHIINTAEHKSSGLFFNCPQLLNVDLPEGLLTLGAGAFCLTNIPTIKIPSSVVEIGESCFSNCENLKNIELPANLKIIGKYAFSETPLESITIPDNITKIEDGTFRYCNNLVEVDFGNSTISSIGREAFYECVSLSNISLPTTLETIGAYAFGRTNLTEITIPDSVLEIFDGSFSNMSQLRKMTIGSGCLRLGDIHNNPILTEIHMRSIMPPKFTTNGFGVNQLFRNNSKDLKIYIPSGSKDYYLADSDWAKLADKIIEE